jgi:hypothetical protein
MESLFDLFNSNGDDLSYWQSLDSAQAVSSDGNTIIGIGTNSSGNQEAFVATISTVPEPNSFVMIVVALAGISRRSRDGQR